MKFGKRLKKQIEETLPEWCDKFLSYKDLKKLLRLISASPDGGVEEEFIRLLVAEVDKFNMFFVEQEEDFVIRHKELQERIVVATEMVEHQLKMEMESIRRDIVNLHGEMVLLENYSNVNYTGLAKILKKYDKRTGRLLRLPFIEKVLKQPFFTTDLISGLVKDLESTMEAVFPIDNSHLHIADHDVASGDNKLGNEEDQGKKVEDAGPAKPGILRNTVAALVTMRELRRGSSTYSHFSLPPISLPEGDQLLQSLQPSSPIPIQ